MNGGAMTSDRHPIAASAARAAPARPDLSARIETVLGTAFGVIFLGLAVIVTIETISRKLFNKRERPREHLGSITTFEFLGQKRRQDVAKQDVLARRFALPPPLFGLDRYA